MAVYYVVYNQAEVGSTTVDTSLYPATSKIIGRYTADVVKVEAASEADAKNLVQGEFRPGTIPIVLTEAEYQ